MPAKHATSGLILCASALLVFSVPAWADSAKSLGKFGAWEGFVYSNKNGKVCYTASAPKKTLGALKDRDDVYVTITHRPADKSFNVVSVTIGYSFKKDSVPEIDIGGARFDLYTTDDSAWARDDKAVVQAMVKGKSMIVHGQPTKGAPTADTYSLEGFPKALVEINKACGVK